MLRTAVVVVEGKRCIYQYKDSWGKRYYSFDDPLKCSESERWYTSKKEAYFAARTAGLLVYEVSGVVQ